jgi:engulfment and cell motility protein 1
VNAPRLEAIEIVDKLYSKDQENRNNKLRMVLFNLAKFISEEQFANEFLKRDGLRAVVEVINSSHGNPLAVSDTTH